MRTSGRNLFGVGLTHSFVADQRVPHGKPGGHHVAPGQMSFLVGKIIGTLQDLNSYLLPMNT